MTSGDQKSPLFIGKSVLHVGCGGSPLPTWLSDNDETRFDIDESYSPDIVGDMRDAESAVQGKRFDVIFTNHSVEHLYPQDVIPTLEGFRAVLNNGGVAIVIVPNLKGIVPTLDVVYESPSGPINGRDMYYGLERLLKDSPYMAHHTGFVKETLELAFKQAGFSSCMVTEDDTFNLIGVGVA
jgi:predicted SAM-dependent methyltransferase